MNLGRGSFLHIRTTAPDDTKGPSEASISSLALTNKKCIAKNIKTRQLQCLPTTVLTCNNLWFRVSLYLTVCNRIFRHESEQLLFKPM